MKHLTLIILSTFIFIGGAHAQSLVEPDYTHDKPSISHPWYVYVSPESQTADLDFIEAMRPHHAGALTMSEEYLNDPGASSTMMKQLARGIIRNQEFEVSMLDRVEFYQKALDLNGTSRLAHVVDKGLSQEQQFYRSPMPGPIDWLAGDDTTSVADVKFAKAMIVHHEGALMMCEDYLNNPKTNNNYLERMCLDILVDQAQEIAFMTEQMNKYSGNLDDIPLDPSMIDGMDDMLHHMPAMAGHKMHGHEMH